MRGLESLKHQALMAIFLSHLMSRPFKTDGEREQFVGEINAVGVDSAAKMFHT